MTITHVQDTGAGASAAAVTAAISSTGGNLLVACGRFFTFSATVSLPAASGGLADTAGNAWSWSPAVAANPPGQLLPGADSSAWLAWKLGASAVTSVTVTSGDSTAAYAECNISEWSGAVSEVTGGTNQCTSGNITAPALAYGAGALAVGYAYNATGTAFAAVPAGSTALNLPGTAEAFAGCYQVFGSAGTLAWDWGTVAAYGNAVVVAAVFAPAAAAAAVPQPYVVPSLAAIQAACW